MAKKDFDIEKALELIEEGKTYREIAKAMRIKLTALTRQFAKPEHSARVREALEASADEYADKAEKVLHDLKKTSNQVEFQRARELAQHYRWKASKRAPKRYGDRVAHTGAEGEPLVPTAINLTIKHAK